MLGEASIGVVLEAVAGSVDGLRSEATAYRWEGTPSLLRRTLQTTLRAETGTAIEEPAATDSAHRVAVAWVIDAEPCDRAPEAYLGETLSRLVKLCGQMAAHPAPLWAIVTFDYVQTIDPPADHPLWCALTSALRVAQNEYPSLEIRCLAIADAQAETLKAVVEELAAPSDEREICFQNGQRIVFRLDHGAPATGKRQTPGPDTVLRLASRSGSSRGALAWTAVPRAPAGPGEVEIAVAAVGLNFRDVMWNLGLLPEEALEDGYAGAQLGMECAGTISAVGPDVDGLSVGDRVVAFVSGRLRQPCRGTGLRRQSAPRASSRSRRPPRCRWRS